MQELRCARCGREGPDAHAFGAAWARAAAAVDDSLPNLLANLWLNVDGADVCPRCQTAAEKEDAARQTMTFTRAAITSHTDAGVDPRPEEDPVIGLAMRIQQALIGRPVPVGGAPNRHGEDDAEKRSKADDRSPTANRTFDVAITGAFLTGCPLRVDIDNYQAVQRDLTGALTGRQEGPGWSSACVEPMATGTYASGGGFSTNVPLVLVCREGSETLEYTRTILGDQTKRAHDWQQERVPGWTLTPTGMRIEVYDVGVGVIDGTFSVDVPPGTESDAFAAGLKEIVGLHVDDKGRDRSAIAGTFRRLCRETTTQFGAAVDRCESTSKLDPWLRPPADGLTTTGWWRWPVRRPGSAHATDGPSSAEWGRLLWLHPVLLLAANTDQDRCAEAGRVAPVVHDTMRVQAGLFVPGIGWSATITADGRPDAAVLKLVHLHWAYFALHMEIDRGLLRVLNRVDTTSTKWVRQDAMERAAADAFDWYARVIQARSRVDSTLASLGGDEQAIWDKIAEVQRYDTLVGGVDRKVDALRKITDRRAQEASSAQARRATLSLGLLAALGLVSLVIASVVYLFGATAPSGQDDRRLVPFAIGIVVAFALWWWINFSKLRRRRR